MHAARLGTFMSLLDDVVNTGAHLIAACRKLDSSKREVVLACTFAATTDNRRAAPFVLQEQVFNL